MARMYITKRVRLQQPTAYSYYHVQRGPKGGGRRHVARFGSKTALHKFVRGVVKRKLGTSVSKTKSVVHAGKRRLGTSRFVRHTYHHITTYRRKH